MKLNLKAEAKKFRKKLKSLRAKDFQKLFTRTRIIHFFIFMISVNFFLWGIDRNSFMVSDEYRYVPAALDFMKQEVRWNWSLPPLGEMLIASGISLFGNNALGWRIMGVIFGALSLNAMFSLSLVLFRKERLALEVVAFCLLNQILFVQSRVATFDVFMFAFIAWGFVFFFRHMETPTKTSLLGSGICFGLAIACKWFAIVPAFFCLTYYLFQDRRKFKARLKLVSIYLIGAPALTYFLTFAFVLGMKIPWWVPRPSSNTWSATPYGVGDFLSLQLTMFKNQLGFQNPSHEFVSAWYTWPFGLKNFSYERAFIEVNGESFFYGIILLGNPFILWIGFGSILVTLFEWIKKKNDLAKIISLVFLTLFLSWAFIPRKTTFFYYYFPAAMILSLSLVFVFEKYKLPSWARATFLVLCALSFSFFYPALAFVSIPVNSALYSLLTW